jgi:hypothetical protein
MSFLLDILVVSFGRTERFSGIPAKRTMDETFEHGEFANMDSPSGARVGQLAFAKPSLPSLVRLRRISIATELSLTTEMVVGLNTLV